jgi:hypothetical protein
MGKLTEVTHRRKAVHDVDGSSRHVVLVSDDDGVVDGINEDEAKMMDTVSSTSKTASGRSEQMERQRRRAARPTTTRRRTTMSWR